jgi:hypothetical protein
VCVREVIDFQVKQVGESVWREMRASTGERGTAALVIACDVEGQDMEWARASGGAGEKREWQGLAPF